MEMSTMPHPSINIHALTRDTPALPLNYPGFMFRTFRQDGYKAEDLLAGTNLTEDSFADPYFRSEFWTLQRFVLNAIEQTRDPHIGPRLALRFETNFIGLPAYAAMNAACMKDALEVLNRFFCLTFPAIEFSFPAGETGLKPGEAAIRLRPIFPLEGITYFVSSSALIVCNGILKAMLRAEQVASRAEITINEPQGWADVSREICSVPLRFGAPENRLVFPAELLTRPLPGADPINHRRLVALCEKFAADAGYDTTPASQVLAFLETEQNLAAPLSQAAAALGYSERGLRRQLERAGTSYRKLVDQVRENRARALLANTARPIQAIAHDLGYDAPSNFARSFRRWTGVTPKAFRAARKAPGDDGQN